MTATQCNTLQHAATRCSKLQHTTPHRVSLLGRNTAAAQCITMHHNATHCNTLQHTATHCHTVCNLGSNMAGTHCTTLHHTATHCDTLQHTATRCNTLQHAATRCNTQSVLPSVVSVLPSVVTWRQPDVMVVLLLEIESHSLLVQCHYLPPPCHDGGRGEWKEKRSLVVRDASSGCVALHVL